jgi:hypothetical protein
MDAELKAVQQVLAILKKLTPGQQEQVMTYVISKISREKQELERAHWDAMKGATSPMVGPGRYVGGLGGPFGDSGGSDRMSLAEQARTER